MRSQPVICVGSALWDIIARAQKPMKPGFDVPGRIERQLGGVALNIAVALERNGVEVEVLSSVGNDAEGAALIAELEKLGIGVAHLDRPQAATDQYLAIELPDGEVFGAVADCHVLEHRAEDVIAPLMDGRLSGPEKPWKGIVVIDGNLPSETLSHLAQANWLGTSHRFLIPASPGKAVRLKHLRGRENVTLTVNRVEAEIISDRGFIGSPAAAQHLLELGFGRAIVTDSARPASVAWEGGIISAPPPDVTVRTLTGAGDSFLAGFIAAERESDSDDPAAFLDAALLTAANHISGRGL